MPHKKNADALVGTVVPWSRIRLMAAHHNLAAMVLDEDGKVSGTLWKPVHWAVPFSQRSAVRRAAKRAERAMLGEQTFDIRETNEESRRGLRTMLCVMLAGVVVCIGCWLWMLSSAAAAAMFARHGFYIGSFPIFAALFGLMALMVWPRVGVNVATVRVFGEGLEAEMIDRRTEHVRWDDILRIRRRQAGPYVIDVRGGLQLRLEVKRAGFVLRDWMERHGAPSEDQAMRPLLVRIAVLCQVGGITGAALIYWMGITTGRTPLGFYLAAGVALPLFLVLVANVDRWMERIASRWRRRSARAHDNRTFTARSAV